MLPLKPLGPLSPIQPSRWGRALRWAELLSIGVLLFLLGQCDEQAFTGLTQLWRSILTVIPGAHTEWLLQLGTQANLSGHGLVVALSYRLLYVVLSVRLLWLVSNRRYLREIAFSYAGIFLTGCLLLLLGRGLQQSILSTMAHQLIDFICSPLALLLAYPIMLLTDRERVAQRIISLDKGEGNAI